MAGSALESLKRRSVAVLAVDLCGYTRLVAKDEGGTLARLLADRQMIGGVVQDCAGRIFNTAGDAVMAEFGSAAEALRAAIAVQQRVERRAAAEADERRMRYRIGMSVGEVVEDGGDLFGDAVNVAARLEKLAPPGGLCLSQAAREAAGAVPNGTRDIGPQRLKNLPRPVPACVVPPHAIGGARGRSERPLRSTLTAALGIALVAGAVAAASPRRAATAPRVGLAAEGFVYGPEAGSGAAAPPAANRLLVPDEVPYVDDAVRARIAAAAAEDRDVAFAISQQGIIGFAPSGQGTTADRDAAVRACSEVGGRGCRLYAAGGEVVWPDPPPPLPPKPWLDDAVRPVPFDANRVAGLGAAGRLRLAKTYEREKPFKALALGPPGMWQSVGDRNSALEAERAALEICGERVGSPCRLVAVGDDFVVPLRKP